MSGFAKIVCIAGCALLASTPAFSADASKPYTKAVPMQVQSWTGAYVGVTAGYGWGESASSVTAIEPNLAVPYQQLGMLPTALKPAARGFIGGGEVGYNWQSGGWVVGLEADFSYSDLRGDETYAVPPVAGNNAVAMTQGAQLDWFGTVRARAGVLITPDTLIFATGGLAYGHVKASSNIVSTDAFFTCSAGPALCSTGTASATRTGWTVGGGLESRFAPNWTVKVEYLYFDLGNISTTANSTSFIPFWNGKPMVGVSSDFTGNIVRVGLNHQL